MTKYLLLCAFVLAGCSRQPERMPMTATHINYFGELQYIQLTNALAHATNVADVLPLLAAEVDAQIIEKLSHEYPARLEKMLADANERKGEYTRRQIIEAMKLRNTYPHIRRKLTVPEQ